MNHGNPQPLRIQLSEERHARVLEQELGELGRLEQERRNGTWEFTVDGLVGDKLVVRVLNAVRTALGDDPTASARVSLDGREYQLQGE